MATFIFFQTLVSFILKMKKLVKKWQMKTSRIQGNGKRMKTRWGECGFWWMTDERIRKTINHRGWDVKSRGEGDEKSWEDDIWGSSIPPGDENLVHPTINTINQIKIKEKNRMRISRMLKIKPHQKKVHLYLEKRYFYLNIFNS